MRAPLLAGLAVALSCAVPMPASAVTLADNITQTTNGGVDVGYVSGVIDWQAVKFDTTTASLIDSISVRLKQGSTAPTTGTLFFDIYTSSSGLPGTAVATAVGSLAAASIASDYTNYTFSPLSVALDQNTSYFLVARPDSYSLNGFTVWDTTASTSGFGFTPPVRARSTNNGSTFFIPGSATYPMVQINASIVEAPAPLPLLGASIALSWSRRLRKRIRLTVVDSQPRQQ